MLNIILIVLAVAVVLFIIIVAIQPENFRISRTTTINAPPAAVFPWVNDVHKFQEWSPWAKADPASKVTFEGPPSGVGASFHWAGGKTGEGRMTNTESRLDEIATYRLDFLKPFTATNIADFELKPEDGQTVVSWSMRGKNGFMFKAFALLMNSDKMVGGDFEKGLSSMKALVEGAKP